MFKITQFVYEKVKKPDFYIQKGDEDRAYFISYIVSNIHHVIIFVGATYALLNPECD